MILYFVDIYQRFLTEIFDKHRSSETTKGFIWYLLINPDNSFWGDMLFFNPTYVTVVILSLTRLHLSLCRDQSLRRRATAAVTASGDGGALSLWQPQLCFLLPSALCIISCIVPEKLGRTESFGRSRKRFWCLRSPLRSLLKWSVLFLMLQKVAFCLEVSRGSQEANSAASRPSFISLRWL